MRRAFRAWLLLGLGTAASVCSAGGLQVAPVMLSLLATQNADGLWLSNVGDDVVHAQVRVYHWSQDATGDHLVASSGLVISPPMITLPVGARQLIRVIRVGPAPSGTGATEDAFRLAIDELPIDTKGRRGLQYVLHYSVPIFIEPKSIVTTGPQLHWALQRNGDQVMLEVSNHGDQRAQLASLSYRGASGQRTELLAGLLGYVLPGATMHWALKPAAPVFAGRGTVQAMVNGDEVSQELSLTDRAH